MDAGAHAQYEGGTGTEATVPSSMASLLRGGLRDLDIRQVVWWLLWFHSGVDYGTVTFFRAQIILYYAVITLAVNFLVFVVLLASGKRLTFRLTSFSILVLLLNVANIASVLLSPVDFESPLRIYASTLTTLALSLVVIVVAQDGDAVELLSSMGRAYVLGAVVTVLAPLLVGRPGELNVNRYEVEGLISPNVIGFEAALALVFTVGGIRKGVGRLFDWPLSMLFAAALILTFSKTSLGAVAVSLGVLWALSGVRQKLGEMCLGAAVVLIPLALFWNRLFWQFTTYLQDTSASSTLSGRLPLWDAVINVSLARPWLGYGFATSPEVLRPFITSWSVGITHAHNAYLTALLQTGMVGLVLLLLIVFTLFRQAIWFLRFRQQPLVRLWIALVALVLVHSLTEGAIGTGNFSFAFVVALGMIGNRLAATARDQAWERSTSPLNLGVLKVGLR